MKKFRQRGKVVGRRSGFSRKIEILYEDDSVIVIDKPPGLLTVPVKGWSKPSALAVLSAELESRKQHALVVHRIDRFASGIVLFAKNQRDREALIRQFLDHRPVRLYLAVVRGHLSEREGTLVHHFTREEQMQRLTKPRDPKGTRAELQYKVEKVLRDATLMRVALVTGLQNQIRAQFAAIGHPVVGDRKYAPDEADERRIARVALHAAHLEFEHPRTGNVITVDSEPPNDFMSLVRSLSR
jgi:RluA family pseudouridine synthase